MKELSYLNKYFWKYKWRFLFGVSFIVISNYFAVKPAQYVRDALDLVNKSAIELKANLGSDIVTSLIDKLGKDIFFFGIMIVAMAFLRGIFLFFMRQSIIVMSRLIEYDLKTRFTPIIKHCH